MPTPKKHVPAGEPGPEKAAPPAADTAAPPVQNSNGKRILIVEDERPLAHALELKFHHEGFDTHICLDGEEALKEATEGTYNVILLDLIMPRMDGFTFLQEMKSRGVKTPTVILSNLGQDEDRARAQELGAVGYYVKSNTPIMEIIKQVQSLL
ncbi:MAG TPA: two-component system response regulator [Candidatus Peribacter riflensis]|uniref:Winged helix family two component transcriptional regulator n=1 Tax=Candidatus Peribacter riflensis TaxID=1735162 RepID=A0A0S1SLD9_9BACT|nr:MAG: winged helix family two component transcriptional regulator [Candidatus Peribacter riflensis]ALM11497.1 MAG: winged helix family two component transcriptional regulator [Candidatus Peribacter riflensis]ALM12599.1 MAG: winged helix family two component transcriptional regulator [Candidatus Peribacter riflensis]ALM13700.1 MAG: winged helix family two component transcriptional regulator [Candidatus Peribacter riflensis]ALM14803.1 MAG: winged helix family two component transcriptional regul